eukprot:7851250-Pyramimonas_sp.AAC.1
MRVEQNQYTERTAAMMKMFSTEMQQQNERMEGQMGFWRFEASARTEALVSVGDTGQERRIACQTTSRPPRGISGAAATATPAMWPPTTTTRTARAITPHA